MITNLLKYACTSFAFILFSYSADIADTPRREEKPIVRIAFRPIAHTGFADVYEEEVLAKISPTILELLNQMRYIVYNASGNIVQEKKLTSTKIEDGFQVILPPDDYRICVLRKGKIVNYIPVGTIFNEIKESPYFKSVQISTYQNARKLVYRGYFFDILKSIAGVQGISPIVLRRATGVLQVEVKGKDSDIIIHDISVGFLQNGIRNSFHTNGTYSYSNQQFPTSSEPYTVHHSLRYASQNDYFRGTYFPAAMGSITCDLTINYQKEGKIYIREIKMNDFLIGPNKRTRLPIIIKK